MFRIENYNLDTEIYGIDTTDADCNVQGLTKPGIRPTLYLSSSVTLSGSGTSQDPYIIE